MAYTSSTPKPEYTEADTPNTPNKESTLVYNNNSSIDNLTFSDVSGNTIKNLVGGIINYDGINTTGGLFNSFDTRGGGKIKKSKTKSAKTVKATKAAKSAKTVKTTKTSKTAKTTKTSKTAKTAKTTKTSKTAKSVKSNINDVKIPKKIINELHNNINKMYKIYNKKNKGNGMKGGGNDSGIPDNYFNTTDLALANFIPTPYDPYANNKSLLLSNFGSLY